MPKYTPYLITAFLATQTLTHPLDAAWGRKKASKVVEESNPLVLPVEDYFLSGLEAFNQKKWKVARINFNAVLDNYPKSTYAIEGSYYLGVALFNLAEYDLSNDAFNRYLQGQSNPEYFQESIEYKFYAAEQLRTGARCRVLGSHALPRWSTGHDLAIEIYDEVISTLPSDELAAKALFSKACLLWEQKDYRESVDNYQAVIKRFPNHELAPESYLMITKLYIEQSRQEFQNPDLLAFSQINLRRFERDFPQEERLEEARHDLKNLKETYAQGLFHTGKFYERIAKPRSAIIYYQKAIIEFPETNVAEKARNRLARLCPHALEAAVPKKVEEEIETEDFDLNEFMKTVDKQA